MTLAEDIDELEKKFKTAAFRPVVRLAPENFKAMVRKAKVDFKRRMISD